jgi:maltose/moltooligosaccharide transporter
MKFNWKQAIFLGFGFMSIFLIWPIYNQFIPIFLQAGNPNWELESGVLRPSATDITGFGLSPAFAFFIMTWDNILNIFVQFWAGARSDRSWSRWGRRKPWLMVGVPIAALGFVLIPFARVLAGMLLFIFITNIGMALFRAPTAALLGDLFPPEHRSKARGISGVMATMAGIIALVAGSALFERVGRGAPFIFSAIFMVATTILLLIFVKEPRPTEPEDAKSDNIIREALQSVWKAENHSALWLLLSVALTFMLWESLQVGISSFAVFVLGLPVEQAVRFGIPFAIALLLSAYPSGLAATRFGRQRTMGVGLGGLFVLTILAYLVVRDPLSFGIILVLAGVFLSLVIINDLPFLYDIGDESKTGAYTGIYFVATQTGAVIGPILAGFMIEISGNHRIIFAFASLCALLAFLMLRRIRISNRKTLLTYRATSH